MRFDLFHLCKFYVTYATACKPTNECVWFCYSQNSVEIFVSSIALFSHGWLHFGYKIGKLIRQFVSQQLSFWAELWSLLTQRLFCCQFTAQFWFVAKLPMDGRSSRQFKMVLNLEIKMALNLEIRIAWVVNNSPKQTVFQLVIFLKYLARKLIEFSIW